MSVTRTYAAVRPILVKAAARAARRYHKPFDECLADAEYHFVRAYRSYDRSADFTHHLRVRLQRLANMPQQEAKRATILARKAADLEMLPEPPDPLAGLSEPALAVVRLALRKPSLGPREIKKRLVRGLTNLGWAAREIAECFAEIRAALS